MGNMIDAVPENLLLSAGRVDGLAADISVRHGGALGRIAAAQKGQVGRSAVALAAAAARWETVNAALYARLADHVKALRISGIEFDRTDRDNGTRIEQASS